MKARAKTLDLILDTVSVNHQAMLYHSLLARDGMICLIGAAAQPHTVRVICQKSE